MSNIADKDRENEIYQDESLFMGLNFMGILQGILRDTNEPFGQWKRETVYRALVIYKITENLWEDSGFKKQPPLILTRDISNKGISVVLIWDLNTPAQDGKSATVRIEIALPLNSSTCILSRQIESDGHILDEKMQDWEGTAEKIDKPLKQAFTTWKSIFK